MCKCNTPLVGPVGCLLRQLGVALILGIKESVGFQGKQVLVYVCYTQGTLVNGGQGVRRVAGGFGRFVPFGGVDVVLWCHLLVGGGSSLGGGRCETLCKTDRTPLGCGDSIGWGASGALASHTKCGSRWGG